MKDNTFICFTKDKGKDDYKPNKSHDYLLCEEETHTNDGNFLCEGSGCPVVDDGNTNGYLKMFSIEDCRPTNNTRELGPSDFYGVDVDEIKEDNVHLIRCRDLLVPRDYDMVPFNTTLGANSTCNLTQDLTQLNNHLTENNVGTYEMLFFIVSVLLIMSLIFNVFLFRAKRKDDATNSFVVSRLGSDEEDEIELV